MTVAPTMASKPDTDSTIVVKTQMVPQVRLEFLDGLRGIAAVYVVMFHATAFSQGLNLSSVATTVQMGLHFGHYAVDVFIVISGYCLMLPVVRSADKQLPRGFVDYIKRRARRILPPYYIALLLSLICVLAGQYLSHSGKIHTKAIPEVLTPGILLSHLFMVQDLSLDWAYRINAPMWSVATEWHIYFIFPCLLLPLWRRFGAVLTVLLAYLIGMLPGLILPPNHNFWWASPWFIGLFAMGMAAAAANFGPREASARWRKILVSPITMVALLLGFIALGSSSAPALLMLFGTDFLLGLSVMGLIMFCAQAAMNAHEKTKPAILLFLESPLIVRLGTFSYSLYLIHHPLQQIALRLFQTRFHTPESVLFLQLVIGTPLIIATAYLFYLFFERPFLSFTRQRSS